MQLTKQTDFAFRTLLYLARLPEDELGNIQQLAEFYGISQHHIAKVVVKLGHLGYIHTVRGKGGGIHLSKQAYSVSLADIVCAFESSMEAVNCKEPACRLAPNCKLKGVLDDAMQAFLAVLQRYTLADIVDSDVQVINTLLPGTAAD